MTITKSVAVSSNDNIIDIRDVIARFEELEAELEAAGVESDETEEIGNEWESLLALLEDLKGNGGDEQWRGDWYPVTLIRDTHFVEAMQDLCDDIGDIPKELPNYIVIDWEATAKNLRMYYSSVEFNDVTYWYR